MFLWRIIVAGCCHIINEFWASIIIWVISGGLTTYLSNILSNRLKRKDIMKLLILFIILEYLGFLDCKIKTIFIGNLDKIDEKIEIEVLGYYIENIINSTINFDESKKPWEYAGVHFSAFFITLAIGIASIIFAGFIIKFCNCNIAIRYFNDCEYFDIRENDRFPLKISKMNFNIIK